MMKRLAQFLDLSAREQRGFFVLLLLMAVLLFFPVIRSCFVGEPDDIVYALIDFEAKSDEQKRSSFGTSEPRYVQQTKTISSTLFPFDPNQLPEADWKRLGLSEKQIQVIKNYEAKGGKFRYKEDLKKIYSISDLLYKRLEPYIIISSTHSRESNSDFNAPSLYIKSPFEGRRVVRLNINQADTSDWQQLRGIGSTFSNRIVRFRDALGGFNRIEQLKEVYGLSNELYESIVPNLILDTEPQIVRIKINQLTSEQLQKHPYITAKEATIIVNYRDQHGVFLSLVEMKKIIALDAIFFLKIEPYLDFNP